MLANVASSGSLVSAGYAHATLDDNEQGNCRTRREGEACSCLNNLHFRSNASLHICVTAFYTISPSTQLYDRTLADEIV